MWRLTLQDVIDDIQNQLHDTNIYAYTYYNRCFGGGPFLNDGLGLDTYNRISGNNYKNMHEAEAATNATTFRVNTSLVLLQIGREKAQCCSSSFGLVRVPRQYHAYLFLTDYDGKEEPWVKKDLILKSKLTEHFKASPDRILTERDFKAILESKDAILQYIEIP